MFLLSPIVTAPQLNCSVQAALLVFCWGAGRIKALQFETLMVQSLWDKWKDLGGGYY